MLDFISNSKNIKNLESALMVSNIKHKVTANNIANVDTPYFKRSEVAFEAYLKEYLDKMENPKKDIIGDSKLAMALTNSRHISIYKNKTEEPGLFLGATIRTVDDQTMRTDQNNVDIDIEMAEMAKNTIYYQAVSQRINGYFSSLRSVIEGR